MFTHIQNCLFIVLTFGLSAWNDTILWIFFPFVDIQLKNCLILLTYSVSAWNDTVQWLSLPSMQSSIHSLLCYVLYTKVWYHNCLLLRSQLYCNVYNLYYAIPNLVLEINRLRSFYLRNWFATCVRCCNISHAIIMSLRLYLYLLYAIIMSFGYHNVV